MDIKKRVGMAVAWLLSLVIATTVATNCVAQQLIPPPPVQGAGGMDLTPIEMRLKEIDKKLERVAQSNRSINRMVTAIWTKLFPLKMEQRAQDFQDGDE